MCEFFLANLADLVIPGCLGKLRWDLLKKKKKQKKRALLTNAAAAPHIHTGFYNSHFSLEYEFNKNSGLGL